MDEIGNLRPKAAPTVGEDLPWRSWSLSLALVVAAVIAGLSLRQFGGLYPALGSGRGDVAFTVAAVLFAMLLLSLSLALVSALVRPLSVAALFILLAAVLIFLAWKPGPWQALGTAVFLGLGLYYLQSVRNGLLGRVRFSAAWIGFGSSSALTGFLIAACISLYAGTSAHIRQHGFTFPAGMEPLIGRLSEYYLAVAIPPEMQALDQGQLSSMLQAQVKDSLGRMVEPFSAYIPLLYALLAYPPLSLGGRLISLVSALTLELLFPVLEWGGLVELQVRREEVERLVPR
jgi:hypothetical protein